MPTRHWQYRFYPSAEGKRYPRLWSAFSSQIIRCVGAISRFVMTRHRVSAINLARAQELLGRLHESRAGSLISVMNHSAIFDDLCITSMLAASARQLSDPSYMRLTPVAADIAFKTLPAALFFALGNCVPAHRTVRDPATGAVTLRGLGPRQESFEFLVSELRRGGRWVNILPQGRVIVGEEKARETEIQFRWGVGRLVADAEPTPLVLPVWHEGIELICPEISGLLQPIWGILRALRESRPSGGHPVTISFGEPIDFSQTLREMRRSGATEEAIWAAVTDTIRTRMMELREETLRIHRDRCAGPPKA